MLLISLRSWLNSPWAGNMADELCKAANILRKFNEVRLGVLCHVVFGLFELVVFESWCTCTSSHARCDAHFGTWLGGFRRC
jgi:hypothetical protein